MGKLSLNCMTQQDLLEQRRWYLLLVLVSSFPEQPAAMIELSSRMLPTAPYSVKQPTIAWWVRFPLTLIQSIWVVPSVRRMTK